MLKFLPVKPLLCHHMLLDIERTDLEQKHSSSQLPGRAIAPSGVPVKVIHTTHMEILGAGVVLLTAPHARGERADLHTGRIVEDTARRANSYAIIGKTSREHVDLNRIDAFRTRFRRSINEFLDENGIRCILDVHGKKDPGIDIGTCRGITASEALTELVRGRLSKDFSVRVNEKYLGNKPGSIVTSYGRKDPSGRFLVEAIQLEFGREERQLEHDRIVRAMVDLVELINVKLGL